MYYLLNVVECHDGTELCIRLLSNGVNMFDKASFNVFFVIFLNESVFCFRLFAFM